MSDPVFSMTQRNPWRVASDASGEQYFYRLSSDTYNALSPPNEYIYRAGAWNSVLASGLGDTVQQRLVVDLPADGGSNVALKFFGRPAPIYTPFVNPRVGVGAVWGISPLNGGGFTEYVGEFLGSFGLSIGSVQADGSSVITETQKPFFARRATVSIDRAAFPGFRIIGDFPLTRFPDGQPAQPVSPSPALVVDALGYGQLVVELRGVRPVGSTGQAADQLGFVYRTL